MSHKIAAGARNRQNLQRGSPLPVGEGPRAGNTGIEIAVCPWRTSKTRGRKATPAEVVLRMLLLKHVRDWSYDHPEYVQRTRPVGCLAFCRRRSSPPNVAIPEFGMRCEPDLLNQSIFAHGCDAHDVRVHLHDGLG